MILQCPECATRYVVPDSAIGASGRTVRCASCRHSWFQDPPETAEASEPLVTVVPPVAAPSVAESFAPPTYDGPGEVSVASYDEPAEPRQRSRRPTRNPVRRWTIAAVTAALVMVAAIVGLAWFGSPGTLARLGLPVGDAGASLVIDLPREPERRELASGNELFALTGRVTNPTQTAQRVPDIVAELRDAQGRVIYGWTITPPVRTLAPGANTEFRSAKVDVPAGAQELSLTFAGDRT